MTGYTTPLKIEYWDRALWYFTAASQPSDLPERLSGFALPMLVITGDPDMIVPTADSGRFEGTLPNARLVIIPQAGYVPHEEYTDRFIKEVEESLRQTWNVER